MVLEQRRPHFEDHNYFFHALLGLSSLGNRLDQLIRDHATPPFSAPVSRDEIVEDESLCAVLGLVALRRRLLELVESADVTPRRQDASMPERRNATTAATSILR